MADLSDTSYMDSNTPDPGDTAEGNAPATAADEKFCFSCGEPIKRAAEICPECGVRQAEESDNDPGVAALLSGIGLFFPLLAGAGQIYNGEVGKGIAFIVIQHLNIALMFVLVGFVTYPLFGIFTVYDAYKNA